jgi:hypothetical protein
VEPELNLTTLSALSGLALVLGGCGGGGGAPFTPPPDPPVLPPASAVQVVADAGIAAGKMASATALPASGVVADISWTQVSGPTVSLLASRSPTVAFESASVGLVRLRADVRMTDGSTSSVTADINVGAAPVGSHVTVRADHAVRPGADTSVRAWPTLAAGETLSKIVWTQLSGPSVTMDTSTERVLMFRAPAAGSGTTLRFRATMTTSSGGQDQDEVTIGLDRAPATPDGSLFDNVARVHPYRSAGLYTSVLARCTWDTGLFYLDNARNNLCTAGTLPLLETEAGPGAIPSVAQVMGRVLVSHDVLGANFEQFLLTQDPHGDFRRLLGATTAIVLGSHVRPSFYFSATGAIYLDANNLWLGAAERDLVTEVPDYRLAFDDALNYSAFGRQVRNNAYVRRAFPSTERNTRTIDELVYALGRLLYHELAHAGDFFPPSARTLDPARSIWANAVSRIDASVLPSDMLAAQYPLVSVEMKALGQVLYLGATPTAVQKAYTAAQVGGFFASDRASDDYAYAIQSGSNSREDLALLFEEFMMGHRHGVQFDAAYTNLATDSMTDEQVLVAWGQRGRITEPSIKPRAKLVLQQIAPWIATAAVDALPAPLMMRPGVSWEGNLVLGGSAMVKRSAKQVGAAERIERIKDDRKKPRH